HLDVADPDGWQSLIDEIVSVEGGIDVLINNAGIFRTSRMTDTTLAEFEEVMRINCQGVFLGMQTVAAPMIQRGGGSIVNISSLAGLRSAAGAFAYSASKWAVRGMTKTAAVELARKGVRVNSVHPGLIETPMADQLGSAERMKSRIPMGRGASAGEVANLALFLASDESSYSTGSEFIIDGGMNAL
ncbi:MAG: SDR family oxidoreductase, partial [Pseudomonadales bacterium]|nr:SDR family oxidoreductase [Pseudomonadales bacterium]